MSTWPTVTLGEVAEINRIGVDPRMLAPGTRYIGLEHIASGGGSVHPVMLANGDLASTKFRFTEEHLLFGKLRPYLAKIVSVDFAGVCSTDILPILPGPSIDREYLRHYLLQPSVVAYAASLASGVNLPRLSPAALMALPIPRPPVAEQRRIAEILDRADALRAKRRAALDHFDILTESIFLEMFGDPISNPRGWPEKQLGELGSLDRGVSKARPRNAPELLGGVHPLVQTGDVSNCDGYIRSYKSTYSELGLRQSKKWPRGTLCITIAANIAKVGILEFDACFPDSVVGFTAKTRAVVEFVRCWFSFVQASLEERAPVSAQKNINLQVLRTLSVVVPPEDLLNTFAERIAKLECLKETHRASLVALDTLFASLQHRAFRGEL